MLVFSDIQNDLGIQRIATYCVTTPEFADLTNAVLRRLLRRGDWAGTLQPIYLCVQNGCVVWPRYTGTVRALGWCGRQVKPENIWGSFLPRGNSEAWRHGVRWFEGHHCYSAMIQQGRTSVFTDIQGDGRTVRAYCRCNPDIGKTVTIFGTDNNGQPLQTQNVDGSWSIGQVLTLQMPFVSTSTFVRSIDYVLKDPTQCPINLYAYNATTNLLEDLAQYDPGETRPSYERTKIQLPWGLFTGGSTCCGAGFGVAALVKLKFIPVQFPTDLVLIDNLDAIKLGFQSVKVGESAGGLGESKQFEAAAIMELNRQLEDESPDDQFVADNQVFASHTFTNHAH